MKRKLFLTLVAALGLAIACQKTAGEEGSVVLADPATKELACVITPNEPLSLLLPFRNNPTEPVTAHADDPVRATISRIELTEASRYVVVFSKMETKASSPACVWTGSYTYSDGKYKLAGFGTLEITSGSFILLPGLTGASSVTCPASFRAMSTSGTLANNTARTWKVMRTYVEVEGGKVSLGKEFIGLNFQEIAIALRKAGADFTDKDIESFNGYTVGEIIFTGANTLTLAFSGAIPFYGTWNLSGTSFNWQLEDSNAMISGQASGTICFPFDKKCELSVKGTIQDGTMSYPCSLIINMDEVK